MCNVDLGHVGVWSSKIRAFGYSLLYLVSLCEHKLGSLLCILLYVCLNCRNVISFNLGSKSTSKKETGKHNLGTTYEVRMSNRLIAITILLSGA